MNAAVGIGLTLTPLAGGYISSVPSEDGTKNWYPTLDRPKWRPPEWVFRPVWTCLYLGMGYASYRVYRVASFPGISPAHALNAKRGLVLYGVNLALNWMWSPLMFYYRSIPAALVNILALDGVALGTTFAFWRVDRIAGVLMAPYLAWIGFATALTGSLWKRNGDGKGKNL